MIKKTIDDAGYKDGIVKRLKRIEGQIKGIQNMIEKDMSCVDVLTQVAAVRSAINKAGGIILKQYSEKCIAGFPRQSDNEKTMDELVDTVQKFLRFVD